MKTKPRTIGDLYKRIMLEKVRDKNLEYDGVCQHFYITINGEQVELTEANLKRYKDYIPKAKTHDKWDEFVNFII